MLRALLYISLPLLQDYNVKMPNFTFCRGQKFKTTTFFFFSWTLIQSFRTQTQNNLPTIDELTGWNKRDKVLGSANSLFKWRFRSRRRPSFLSSLSIPSLTNLPRPYHIGMTSPDVMLHRLGLFIFIYLCIFIFFATLLWHSKKLQKSFRIRQESPKKPWGLYNKR